jgi:hypothetical protein
VRLVYEDVEMVLLRDIPKYGRVRLLNEVSVGAITTSQLNSLRIERDTYPSIEPLFLGNDSGYETRSAHLHQSPSNFIQSLRIFPLGFRVIQINLAEINSISSIYLNIDQTWREDISTKIDGSSWWAPRGEE